MPDRRRPRRVGRRPRPHDLHAARPVPRTPDLATAFLAAHRGSDTARRTGEIDRYPGWPGQAIGYELGERALLQGRAASRRRLGADFDLRTWYSKALALGSLGLADLAGELALL